MWKKTEPSRQGREGGRPTAPGPLRQSWRRVKTPPNPVALEGKNETNPTWSRKNHFCGPRATPPCPAWSVRERAQ